MKKIKSDLPRKQPLILLILLCLIMVQNTIASESQRVYQKVTDKITASANFYPGEKGKPAIMILHGFMQTSQFPTVLHLAEALNDAGYTVLTPTLSLNISNRKKSLACESIHTHSLQQDIHEVHLWAKWLARKSSESKILIGHSVGSLHAINYLYQYPESIFNRVILISLPYFGSRPYAYESPKDEKAALEALQKSPTLLHQFSLSYCKKYTTTAKAFLSYYRLNANDTAKKLKAIKIRRDLVFGDKDVRIDQSWVKSLSSSGVHLYSIKGANHFFNDEYEFDLQDMIEKLLSQDN